MSSPRDRASRSGLQLSDIEQAQRNIRDIAQSTPLVPSPFASDLIGAPFLLKLELAQSTGAFKIRGAANAIARLPADTAGVVCCSTGNHGRAVAFAARRRGIRAVICMSELVPRAKVDGVRALGAKVLIGGRSQDDAQLAVNDLVREHGLVEVPPFDDIHVIAGQGTIGLELLEQCPELSTVLVPLSGGGLAAGIAVAIKARKPDARVIGVSMQNGAAMFESLRAGKPVEATEVPSLADSLGGGIGLANAFSFALCKQYLDDVVLVSEREIYRAMQTMYFEDRLVCEGGSAVGLAAVQNNHVRFDGKPVCTIVTGRNVDMRIHAEIMRGRDVVLGDVVVPGVAYQ